MTQEDVERFLWDLERKLAHLDGDERRELVHEAEDRLHAVATRIAEHDGVDQVQWYHYVQASAQIGPPERLAAELTGEPLPDRDRTQRWMYGAALGVVLLIAALFAYAYFTTGDLTPVGEWSGQEASFTGQRELTFNLSEGSESAFLSFQIVPNNQDGTARVTVLDGANRLVYEDRATLSDHLETATFVQGEPGTWRVFVDFETFTGSWSVQAKEEAR